MSKIKDKILIIEDEKSIAGLIEAILSSNGFDVVIAKNAADGYAMTSSHCPDLIILDLGLPDFDGVQLIEMVRSWSTVPIVVVSARSTERDKVVALEEGADDYITKPFGGAELLARVRVALRHSRSSGGNKEVAATGKLRIKDLLIDYDKHQVLINGNNAHLTQVEFKIVSLLGQYAGKVLTYDSIMKRLWGPASGGDNQILRVNMANIRRKIEKNPAQPEYIFTEVGIGYRMIES